jgi:fructose 1,6-bisphosphate aldolase/phosphatase
MLLIIPNGDWVRSRIAEKATEIRAQGFSGADMLAHSELEYGGIVAKMNKLEKFFTVKKRCKKIIHLVST